MAHRSARGSQLRNGGLVALLFAVAVYATGPRTTLAGGFGPAQGGAADTLAAITTHTAGQALTWDGTAWVASTISGSSGPLPANSTGQAIPDLTGWTALNVGASTYSLVSGHGRSAIQFANQSESAHHLRGLHRAITATPCAIECAVVVPFATADNDSTSAFAGCGLYDSVSGKSYLCGFDTTNSARAGAFYWTDLAGGAGSATLASKGAVPSAGASVVNWYRIEDDGVNITYKFSRDGITWSTITTVAIASYFVPNEFVLWVDNTSGAALTANFVHLAFGSGI